MKSVSPVRTIAGARAAWPLHTAAALAAAGLVLMASTGQAQASAPTETSADPMVGASTDDPGAAPSCALEQSEVTFKAEPDTELTDRFWDYAATSGQWSGGDGTFSIPLPNNDVAWLFSDSFIGQVDDDNTRPEESAFVNNSFVLDSDGVLETRVPTEDGQPASLIPKPTDEPAGWYWVGDGIAGEDGTVQVVAQRYWGGDGGMWDFGWESNNLAKFDPETLELQGLTPLPSGAGIAWGSGILSEDGLLYVYGIKDEGEAKTLYVARTSDGNLDSTWSYWDGRDWVDTEESAAPLLEGAANEMSVTPLNDGYLLITQDTREAFSASIVAYTSCDPMGPFTERGEVYRMPELGGDYGSNVYAYNAHEHPHLRDGNHRVISYNVNSFEPDELYTDTTIYLPRFVDVEVVVTGPGNNAGPIIAIAAVAVGVAAVAGIVLAVSRKRTQEPQDSAVAGKDAAPSGDGAADIGSPS